MRGFGDTFSAGELRIGCVPAGREVSFPYEVDGGERGQVVASYPFELGPDDVGMLGGIGYGVAIYLGSLTLAGRVVAGFPVAAELVEALVPVTEMLYDIRRWMDHRPLGPYPAIEAEPSRLTPATEPPSDTGPRSGVLLWSGGKDSTLAAMVLRRNGYEALPVHVTVNAGVSFRETAATRRLAAQLELSPAIVRYRHEGFLELAGRHAIHWDDFPRSNRVPFGRDLVLALLTLPFLRRNGALLHMGHDRECRNARVSYHGKSIPRNDIESRWAAVALERYMSLLFADCQMLPPLAPLTEVRILHELISTAPEVMRNIQFCFWGENCGRCGKCLRYYLAQRVAGVDLLSFQVNPLAEGACPELEDLLAADGDGERLFHREVIYWLGRLAERGDVKPGEPCLANFAEQRLAEVAPALDGLEDELMRAEPDPQVPVGFRSP